MKRWIKKSFNRELLVCFAVVAMLPLFFSGLFLIKIMETKINDDYETKILAQAEQIDEGFITLFDNFHTIVEDINSNTKIVSMLNEVDTWSKSKTYLQFYKEVSNYRPYAQFDLYNRQGECVFTTAQGTKREKLPTYWGILYAVEDNDSTDQLVFRRAEENENGVLFHIAGKLGGEDGKTKGYVVISMNEDNFKRVIRESGNEKAEVAFLDSYWRVVYGTGFQQADQIRENLMKGYRVTGTYHTGEVLIEPLGNSGLYTIISCPNVFSKEVLRTMYRVLIVMITISGVLCIIVVAGLSRNLTRPIEKMNTAMKKLQEGNLDVRIASDREDELGQMSVNFNIMANELAQNVQERVQRQKELNASHIAMMQAQLNPHFLYNTLDTMKWVAKVNHIPEIATMAAGLAKILRTSISKRQFIQLKEELDLVKCYVDIQKIRFNDSFTYFVDIQEGLEECIIPKLIIQPVVENSVLHGLKESEKGKICVKIQEKADVLQIEVTDDGCGISDEYMEALNNRQQERMEGHIGVSNVDTIIRLTYGEEYGIHIERSDEGGTRVVLQLPLKYEEI